jgi:hypothetical protein
LFSRQFFVLNLINIDGRTMKINKCKIIDAKLFRYWWWSFLSIQKVSFKKEFVLFSHSNLLGSFFILLHIHKMMRKLFGAKFKTERSWWCSLSKPSIIIRTIKKSSLLTCCASREGSSKMRSKKRFEKNSQLNWKRRILCLCVQ